MKETQEEAGLKQKPRHSTCVFAGANFFHLSLVLVQTLFNGILNCNKIHVWSLGKNIFCYVGPGYVSVPPFSAFSDLCCVIGYVAPAVRVPTSALHKPSPPPPPSAASCLLRKGSLSLRPEGSSTRKHTNEQKANGQTTTLALGHAHLKEHDLRTVTVNKLNSCKISQGYSKKNQTFIMFYLSLTQLVSIHVCVEDS